MARFIALTSSGLLPALEEEFKDLNFKKYKPQGNGVWFEGSWKECYRANLMLRTATRVLYPVLNFHAYNQDELYQEIQKHDFTKYIDPDQTIAVEAHGQNHTFNDQRFIALKVKDAVVDQFRDKFGDRPNVDAKNPDLLLVVRLHSGEFSVSVDTSGFSLTKRGYRVETVEAPIREHVAAALIIFSGWDKKSPFMDPMCGSGTLLIEAASMAQNLPPTRINESFAFEKFKNFQEEVFEEVEAEAYKDIIEIPPLIIGSDKNPEALRSANENIIKSGFSKFIKIENQSLLNITSKGIEGAGCIVTNPPFGKRLGGNEDLVELYYNFANLLKERFSGWTLGFLSANAEFSEALKMKATRKWPLLNGKIECKFLKYEIR